MKEKLEDGTKMGRHFESGLRLVYDHGTKNMSDGMVFKEKK